MADSFQTLLCEMASMTRPTETSLSATIARGVREPARVPDVWSFPRRMIDSRGIDAVRSNSWNSLSQTSTR
jgi:hypothetical protein